MTEKTHKSEDLDRVVQCAETGDLERLHVENIDTVNVTEQLETLETGSLLLADVSGRPSYCMTQRYPLGRHLTGLTTGTVELGGRGLSLIHI